jgi:glucuronoarabinoxylan endo-1,4-beta-xylanase
VVSPKLRALNPPVKVISPEASEWLHVWSNESACCSEPGGQPSSDPLDCGFPATNCAYGEGYDYGHVLYDDPEAWAAFDILGTHQYDTQVAEPWPADVPDRKPVWQTEMSGVKWWPEQGPSSDINNGVAVAGWVHNALTVGEANAWLWWWENGSSTNEGLLLNGSITKRFHTFGNFTRFVRPGYTRVDITGEIPQDVLLTAFTGNGNVVIVAINRSSSSVDVPITIAGGTAPSSLTPHLTSANADLAPQSPVSVSNATFTAALPGTSVTTFVGN